MFNTTDWGTPYYNNCALQTTHERIIRATSLSAREPMGLL